MLVWVPLAVRCLSHTNVFFKESWQVWSGLAEWPWQNWYKILQNGALSSFMVHHYTLSFLLVLNIYHMLLQKCWHDVPSDFASVFNRIMFFIFATSFRDRDSPSWAGARLFGFTLVSLRLYFTTSCTWTYPINTQKADEKRKEQENNVSQESFFGLSLRKRVDEIPSIAGAEFRNLPNGLWDQQPPLSMGYVQRVRVKEAWDYALRWADAAARRTKEILEFTSRRMRELEKSKPDQNGRKAEVRRELAKIEPA